MPLGCYDASMGSIALRLAAWLPCVLAGCASPPASSDRDAMVPDATSGPDAPSFGGGVAGDPLDPSDASLPARVASVLRTTCAGGPESHCHSSRAGGLELRLDRDGGDVIGVPSTERPDLARVAPGDPARSYLYLKVLEDGGVDGGRMPLLEPFDPRLPDLIGRWIVDGAPTD